MKITAVETYWTQTPFDMGGKPKVMGGLNWQTMNTVWLRVRTDAGIDGTGGYGVTSWKVCAMPDSRSPPLG